MLRAVLLALSVAVLAGAQACTDQKDVRLRRCRACRRVAKPRHAAPSPPPRPPLQELACLEVSACAWCRGGAGGAAGCQSNATAAPQPSQCGNGLETYCSTLANSNATCQALVGCYWCSSRTVGPICAGWNEQKRLPKSVFTCAGPY